ncbi:retrotransposon protein, putative, ty1-copia subclass [Tanacetum coccineum]
MLPQDLVVGLILNGLTKYFARFVRNYNMHNMGKTIGELHAMLIEYEKGLPKKAETPQVMMIKGGGGSLEKELTVYLAELLKKKKQVGSTSSSGKMTRKSFLQRPERVTDLLGIIHTDVCDPLRHVSRQGASYFITFTDDYSRYGYVYLLKHKRLDRGGEYISQEFKEYLKASGIVQHLTPSYTPQHNGVSERRNRTLLDMVRSMMNLTNFAVVLLGLCSRDCYTHSQYGSNQEEGSGRAIDLEETKDEDTSPSETTSEIPIEVEGFEPPQEEMIPFHRFERTHQALDRLCLNVEAEEHSLGDLNEPTSYKVAMLDLESNKWIDAINAEIQSMMDNMWNGKAPSKVLLQSLLHKLNYIAASEAEMEAVWIRKFISGLGSLKVHRTRLLELALIHTKLSSEGRLFLDDLDQQTLLAEQHKPPPSATKIQTASKRAAGSKDRPPMLGPERYSQWRSRFLRYIDTKGNGEYLRKCIFKGKDKKDKCYCARYQARTTQKHLKEVKRIFKYLKSVTLTCGLWYPKDYGCENYTAFSDADNAGALILEKHFLEGTTVPW